MTETLTIFEVGPRDGLQNEARIIPTTDKIRLVDALSAAGLGKIEVTSFVSPKWVPQMADASQVLTGIARAPGVVYAALTPNLQGLRAALDAGADEVAIFASASEGFSRRNINCSIPESLERFAAVAAAARKAGVPVRGYVSCVCDCPYDGPTRPETVADLATRLLELGVYEVSLGDTIGSGTPQKVAALLKAVTAQVPKSRLAGHFHDTGGRALDNIRTALTYGLRVFDAAVGGLGGCPYAPGAPGNVATEAVAELAAHEGFETGIDHERLARAAMLAQSLRSMP